MHALSKLPQTYVNKPEVEKRVQKRNVDQFYSTIKLVIKMIQLRQKKYEVLCLLQNVLKCITLQMHV